MIGVHSSHEWDVLLHVAHRTPVFDCMWTWFRRNVGNILRIFCGILSIPYNIVVDMNNVMFLIMQVSLFYDWENKIYIEICYMPSEVWVWVWVWVDKVICFGFLITPLGDMRQIWDLSSDSNLGWSHSMIWFRIFKPNFRWHELSGLKVDININEFELTLMVGLTKPWIARLNMYSNPWSNRPFQIG